MNQPLPSLEELEKLPLYDLISLLDDVHVPEAVSYFPTTPIWTWIFWVMALIALLLLYKFWGRLQRERYRKVACHELERISVVSGPAYVMKVSQILKWTALAAYPRKRVASLDGEEWLRFLDLTSDSTEFAEGLGQPLASSRFRRNADVDDHALGALAKKWIRTHRREVLS
jgi:hypothetical protein